MRRGRRTAIPADWRGPDQDACLSPCKGCDGTGTVEDGERVDVDEWIPGLCGDCDGTGVACDEEE